MEPEPEPDRRAPSNIELRRAVLRVLVRARAPLKVSVIVRHLEEVDRLALDVERAATPSQRVVRVLRWQVERGRVRKTGRGVYAAIPGELARTTRWRVDNWDRIEPGRRDGFQTVAERLRPLGVHGRSPRSG